MQIMLEQTLLFRRVNELSGLMIQILVIFRICGWFIVSLLKQMACKSTTRTQNQHTKKIINVNYS